MRGHEKSAHQRFLFNKEIRLANVWIMICRAGKDCVNRLLDKYERTRLGSKSGASEVKQHKWFGKINWGLLRNTRPPVRWALYFPFLSTLCYYGMREGIIIDWLTCSVDHSYLIQWTGCCEFSPSERVELAAP